MTRPPEKIWTVLDILKETQGYFAKCGISSPRLDAELLLGHCLQKDRVRLYLDFECALTPDELARFRELVRRRGKREPVAYITGFKDFWSLRLAVSPCVLIPRPETEVLVEEVLKMLASGGAVSGARILDIGTGSGAIALALAKELPGAAIVACDISAQALETAGLNALSCGVADRIHFMCGDSLAALPEATAFHAIVANPPYIPSADIDALAPEIKNFEPRLALDGGPDGLDFYLAWIPQLPAYLCPQGLVAMEIGDTQGEAVSGLLQSAGVFADVRICKDYGHKPRLVTARRI
jgi:release factor glutamine methyltransferase